MQDTCFGLATLHPKSHLFRLKSPQISTGEAARSVLQATGCSGPVPGRLHNSILSSLGLAQTWSSSPSRQVVLGEVKSSV